MIKIDRITSEDQDKIIDRKLEERTNLAILTSEQHPQHLANRIVAYDLCQQDWKYFVNNFVWLEDPEAEELKDKELPFLLYDYQEHAGDEIVKAIEEGYDIPVEKARKLGITWLVLVIILWGWHFRQWDALVGSRKAEEVDKRGDNGTLFHKIRFMIKRLPTWIFEKPLDHNTDKIMLTIHPKHGAVIAGEGNNQDFGRSDRKKLCFLDEFTSWEQTDVAAYQGLSATVKCRIPVSTPNRRGVNCEFYRIIQSAKRKEQKYLRLEWTLHPRFTEGLYTNQLGELRSPWYDYQCERAANPESVPQEIDINYEASMAGKVFGEFTPSDQVIEGLEYDPNLPLYVAWDFGLDQTAMLWIQPNLKNKTYNIIDEYVNDGNGAGDNIYHYIDILDSKGYKPGIHYGDPHSGENRSISSGQSPASILRRNGINFKCKRAKVVSRIAAGRNILQQVRVAEHCTLAMEMFTSWQMRKPKTGNTNTSVPDHSEHSHIGEAYTYFAYNHAQDIQRYKKTVRKSYRSINGVT